jgi:hypothetical protein
MLPLRVFALLASAVLPGLGVMSISAYYLFPEWMALDRSYQNYQTLATQGADTRVLSIAESAEMRHRINCFAEGVGVLLGGILLAVGVHGLCTLPTSRK